MTDFPPRSQMARVSLIDQAMHTPAPRNPSVLGATSQSLLGATLVVVMGTHSALDRVWTSTLDLLAGLTLQGRLVLSDPLKWENRDLLDLE